MNWAASNVVQSAIVGFGICGVMAINACTVSGVVAGQPLTNPTIEVLALSRGRGVPEAARETLEDISTIVDSAIESGVVVSVTRETIGLEGETRLCIVFRDRSALASLGGEMRELAQDVDLLQVNENNCSVKLEEQ